MILFIKNIHLEGPETLLDFFVEKRCDTRTVSLDQGDPLPDNLDELEAVVVLGGPMNVYEEEAHPYLRDETLFIQKVLNERIPFLGICLGGQMLAKACGAPITRSPQPEIGFFPLTLTSVGKVDPLFKGLPDTFDVFQWHFDMFAIPAAGQLLASSERCPHQAYKLGVNAYGFQFHIEVVERNVREWSASYLQENASAETARFIDGMLADYRQKEAAFHATARTIYQNFYEMITASRSAGRSVPFKN